jgi:hypothetical protein
MRWIFITANVLAAIAFEFLGGMAVAAHRTHAYSTYHELQERHVLVERADYDVEQRLRTIAAGGSYYLWLSHLAASACIVNAVVIAVLCRRRPIHARDCVKTDA